MYYIYRLPHLYRYIANYVYKSMISKRWITLPVVYSRPSPLTVPYNNSLFYYKEQSTANSNSFKIAQKTAYEAKGRLYTTGKVIQRLLIIDLYTY